MTIRKGEPWGVESTVPADVIDVGSDALLASVGDGTAMLTGGDLHVALGRPPRKAAGESCTIVPIDALVCSIGRSDGSLEERLVASRVEIGSWLRPGARFLCITNTGIVDGLNLAPRAHPNDGHFDVLEIAGTMTLRQRFLARRRARTGTHVPHPLVHLSRSTSTSIDSSSRGERLMLDGTPVADWKTIDVRIVPDRWRVAI